MKKSRLEQAFDSAVAHHQAGRLSDAEVLYRKVLATQPNHADALHLLGVLAAQIDRFDDAIQLITKACTLAPHIADYRAHLGHAYGEKKDFLPAIEAYGHALRLNPKCHLSHDGLGAALRETGHVEEAIVSHLRSLQMSPNNPTAHYNLGMTYERKNALDEAIISYRRAISLDPNYAEAHWNLSLLQLLLGDFEQGWREYEWRWRRKNYVRLWPEFTQPRWNGEAPAGKTILVHTEQGYGDAVQFVRYASMLAARGAKVIFLCQAPLAQLMKYASGIEQVVTAIVSDDQLPPFDLHCPMLSLPALFQTRLESVPAAVPYLHLDPSLLRKCSGALTPGPLKVGLVWAGSPTHKNDRFRSITLEQLAPLARSEAVFYSLQKGPASGQAAHPPAGMSLVDLTDDLHDFADTAALISHLDLVITVDTAVAHVAGALAKPVWVLLATEQDWRWLLRRDDTPWYPTMRLFRQTAPGAWPQVIERVANELSLLATTARKAA